MSKKEIFAEYIAERKKFYEAVKVLRQAINEYENAMNDINCKMGGITCLMTDSEEASKMDVANVSIFKAHVVDAVSDINSLKGLLRD